MSTPALCGICSQQPPKYKCPTCQVPYCSLACYKPHKASHSSLAPSIAAAPSQPSATTTPISATSSVPTQHPIHTQPNPQALLISAPLRTLLANNPTLLSELRSMYTSTLEPSNPASTYNATTSSSSNNRSHPYQSRARGRGRGGRGRGRGNFNTNNDRPKAPWTQERADDEAARMIEKSRAEEGDEGKVVKEFVRMVRDVMGGVHVIGKEDGKMGEEMDVGAVAVLNGGGAGAMGVERAREEGRPMVQEIGE